MEVYLIKITLHSHKWVIAYVIQSRAVIRSKTLISKQLLYVTNTLS